MKTSVLNFGFELKMIGLQKPCPGGGNVNNSYLFVCSVLFVATTLIFS